MCSSAFADISLGTIEGDASLCPSNKAVESCIKQYENELLPSLEDCALEDEEDGELCLSDVA